MELLSVCKAVRQRSLQVYGLCIKLEWSTTARIVWISAKNSPDGQSNDDMITHGQKNSTIFIEPYQSYWKHLSPFIRSKVIEVSCPDGSYTPNIVSKETFPHLKLLILNRELSSSFIHHPRINRYFTAVGLCEIKSHTQRSNYRFNLEHLDQLEDAKKGRYDTKLIEMFDQGEPDATGYTSVQSVPERRKTWTSYIDEIYERSFVIHCQSVVEFVFPGQIRTFSNQQLLDVTTLSACKLEDEGLRRYYMVLYWDYDRKVVLERHFSEGFHVYGQIGDFIGDFKCLTRGYCTSCSDDTVSDFQCWRNVRCFR